MLSLERCICVIFPFKVKQIFTRNRAIVCVIFVYLILASIMVPFYSTQRLEWVNRDVETVNGTVSTRQQIIVFADNRETVEDYVVFMNVTVIPIPSQVIVLASMVGMAYGLTTSSKKRKSMTAANKNEDSKLDSKLEMKTKRLVKVVFFLATIFFICSIPRTVASYLTRIIPEVHPATGTEANTSWFCWQFSRFFSGLNASVNFFVYLKINSSYRAKFREIFYRNDN